LSAAEPTRNSDGEREASLDAQQCLEHSQEPGLSRNGGLRQTARRRTPAPAASESWATGASEADRLHLPDAARGVVAHPGAGVGESGMLCGRAGAVGGKSATATRGPGRRLSPPPGSARLQDLRL